MIDLVMGMYLVCQTISGVTSVTLPAPGYRLPNGDFVHRNEISQSDDGQFHYCQNNRGEYKLFVPRVS